MKSLPLISQVESYSRFSVSVIAFHFPPELFSVGVTEISVKTGDESSAGTDAGADLEICDGLGNCCQTLGLDNHGNDREKGQIDVYSGSLLSNCSQVRVSLPFDVVLPLLSLSAYP